ncbi:MAG: hypothetical protein ABIW50_00465 [Candidatus Limnocylindria bacterium]
MFSRDQILGGMPARRASGVLFAIEAQTARLIASSRVSRATYVSERTSAEREGAFLSAMSAGRDLPVQPTVRDLERFAPDWVVLAPESPEARAAVAGLLAGKYRFTYARVPRLRRALGLDEATVKDAFERQHGRPIASIYADRLTIREQLAWARAGAAERIERMPAFWIAYALSITETIGEGILIVPIAVAGIGPLAGVGVLVVLGIINLITLGAMVEAITRNGSMRYGSAYFGRLVKELLGSAGSISLSLALAIFNGVVLLVYMLGFASVLTGATGIPEVAWVALLFGINAYFLRREGLDETVASAVVIGAVNIGLVLAITALAFGHMDLANLGYVNLPFIDGRPMDPLILQLVFGVVIVSYFGHTSAANASKLILGRDPSGRALLWGNLAALGTVIVLYSLAVIAFAGAVGPSIADTRGTAITPLAREVGPIIDVLGSLYVVLAIGLGTIYTSLGLYNQTVELLPTPATIEAGAGRVRRMAATPRGRMLIGLSPTLVITLGLEFLLITGQDWFAGPIGYVGVLTVPLLGGVFPMLLVLAARRRGEYVPGRTIRVIGHPVTVVTISAIFLAGVLLHGLVIWEGPIERAAAIAVAVLMALVTAWIVRGGSLLSQTVVELRDAEPGGSHRPGFTITSGGRPLSAEIILDYGTRSDERIGHSGEIGSFSGLGRARFRLAEEHRGSVRVWVHRVSSGGESIELPSSYEVLGPEPGRRPTTIDIHLGQPPATGVATA